MDQSTHEVRLANWKAVVRECQSRPKGQTARQWLAEHEVPEKQYYYWLRRVRKQSYEELNSALPAVKQPPTTPSFVEIPAENIYSPEISPAPAVIIRTKRSSMEISSSVPGTLILELVKAVSHAL